jgi:phage head maturation protease
VPRELRDEPAGAYFEVALFSAPYVNENVLPGLRGGQYGSSFRFTVGRDEIRQHPTRSEHNPGGLPEVSVMEARVIEFGPVSFPAYRGATAGVRLSSKRSADIRAALVHDAAYRLGIDERWAVRSKPSDPSVIERQRVSRYELADWERERPSWWLGDPRQSIEDVTAQARHSWWLD